MLFGPGRLVWGESSSVANFPTRRALYLLARLAVGSRKRVTRRELAAVLWPDEPYEATAPRLRQELTRLRKALGEASWVIESDTTRIWLSADVETDIERFEELVGAAKEPSSEREQLLDEAAQLSAEPLLEGALEEWIVAERRRLGHLRYRVLVDLSRALSARGQRERAIETAIKATELVPHREDAHLLLMRLLQESGQPVDALAQFQTLRRLASDSGRIQVSPAAERLAEEIRTDRPNDVLRPLPHASESIGREEELERLLEWLHPECGSARLVSILGPGGIGKTHLLMHACHALRHPFDSLVAFVNLSEIADPELIPDQILRSLDGDYLPTNDPLAQVSSLLPARPMLLALDNLEQFGSSITGILSRLLQENPQLRLVVTSRTAVNLSGEHRLALAALGVPNGPDEPESPAVKLFLKSAQNAGVSISDNDLPVIYEIVRRLEGIPLGISLAASRMRALGARELLESLEEDLPSLDTPSEGVPERHRSLRNAVAGSFDLLSPELRKVLISLSVFRGGWTSAAAAEVLGLTDARPAMDQLLSASLIERRGQEDPPRFAMLELVREHAKTLLTEDELASLRDRHLAWIERRSKDVSDPIVTEAMIARYTPLEKEMDNIREAVRYALDRSPDQAFQLTANLALFWLYRTTTFEAQQFFRELFERHGNRPPTADMLETSYRHSLVCHFQSNLGRLAVYDRTIEIGKALGSRIHEPMLLTLRAFHFHNVYQYAECERLIEQAEGISTEVRSDNWSGLLLRLKGTIAFYQGDLKESLRFYRDSLKWYREKGQVFHLVLAKLNCGRAALELGDFELAEAMLSGLIEDARRIRHDILMPSIHNVNARLDAAMGRREDAIARFEVARSLWEQRGNDFRIGEQDYEIGRTHFAAGELEAAGRSFAAATARWRPKDPVQLALGLLGCATVLHELGHLTKARRIGRIALETLAASEVRLPPQQYRMSKDLARRLDADIDTDSDLTLEEAAALATASLVL